MQSSPNHHTSRSCGARFGHSLAWGTALGCLSAVGYTAANIFLRAAIHCDPILVSCVKAFPTVALVVPWLALRRLAGERILPDGRTLAILVGAGLLAQFGGNVVFQWALGMIGMALTVPLCLGAIILSSALMGRVLLNESVTPLTLLSMALLILAIWSLSLGADDATQAVATGQVSGWLLAAGVVGACVSGVSYAVLGVVVRYTVIGRASVAVTITTTTAVGLVALGATSLVRLGWDGIAAHSAGDWQVMLLAGLFNFVAYISLTKALQLTNLLYVNALNASQVAMAAIAGVLLFGEVASPAMTVGVGLTALGLLLMPRRSRVASAAAYRPSDLRNESNDLRMEEGVQKPCSRDSSLTSSKSSQEAKGDVSTSLGSGHGAGDSTAWADGACRAKGQ